MASSSVSIHKVLVTGASGFIGLHTTLCALQHGYHVRVTVRNEAQESKVKQALARHIDISGLEFAQADLLQDAGWKEAVHGCDSVIHTASPYILENPKDENILITPIRDGTLRVLRAAMAEGIRRVVLLSSVGTIFDGHEGEKKVFTESDWSNVNKPREIYHKAKTLAEQAAWNWINGPENTHGMEMVAVNPANVMGPVLDGHLHPVVGWYTKIMNAEIPGVPHLQLDLVDVRDLVEILIKAILTPAAAGKRFICSTASISVAEFAEILYENFSQRDFRIVHKNIPDFVIRAMGWFDPTLKVVVPTLNWKYEFSTRQLCSVFDWRPRPYKQTIFEMAESLIAFRIVKKK